MRDSSTEVWNATEGSLLRFLSEVLIDRPLIGARKEDARNRTPGATAVRPAARELAEKVGVIVLALDFRE